jgi:hypothetical protein
VPEATRQGVSQQGALLTAVPLLLILFPHPRPAGR